MTGKKEAPHPMSYTLHGNRPTSRGAALRTLALVGILLLGSGCQNIFHGLFAPRTTPEEQDLTSFGEFRQRAATYYDSGDFHRSRVQYEKALELRPNHEATRLGYAYSLLYINTPSSLISARTEFVGTATAAKRSRRSKSRRNLRTLLRPALYTSNSSTPRTSSMTSSNNRTPPDGWLTAR